MEKCLCPVPDQGSLKGKCRLGWQQCPAELSQPAGGFDSGMVAFSVTARRFHRVCREQAVENTPVAREMDRGSRALGASGICC